METYPLESLLAVRHYREEGAKRSVRLEEARLRESEAAAEAKKEQLDLYRAWRTKEEERRYDSIMGREMTLGQLDDFKAGLAMLADRELRKEEELRQARKDVEKCRSSLQAARDAAKTAMKNTAKIQAHKDLWSEDAKKDAERREDLELEEFRPLSRKGAEAEGEDA